MNIRRLHVVDLIVCGFLLSNQIVASHKLTYHVEEFSGLAHKMMADHGMNTVYTIFIRDVYKFLPKEYKINKALVKKADKSPPVRAFVKLTRNNILSSFPKFNRVYAKEFFGSLLEEVPYNFVVLDNKIKLVQAPTTPAKEKCRNLFSKHYIISRLAREVHFAGEIKVFKNSSNDEIFVVCDNASGTYTPSTQLLPELKNLFDRNFGGSNHGLHFVTKSYKQKIDKKKLLAHYPKPFASKQ